MKTLAKVSFVLFVTAITFSSCEEENLLSDQPVGSAGTNISDSTTGDSQTTDRSDEKDERLYKIEETKEDR